MSLKKSVKARRNAVYEAKWEIIDRYTLTVDFVTLGSEVADNKGAGCDKERPF